MLQIGSLKLDVPVFQAPLSGYTDQAMCMLALQHQAPLVFTSLMLDNSVLHPGVLQKPIYALHPEQHPLGGQLLGSDPDLMAQAATVLYERGYDLIDLNFACPVPKVILKNRGGYLLTQPDQAIRIMRKVRKAVPCPVTVKLRVGYDHNPISQKKLRLICNAASEEGLDAVTLHGRTVLQRYHGPADWGIIRQIKEELPHLTVIGSGDLFQAEDALKQLKQSGINGLSIARGAIGNPWIFNQLHALYHNLPKPAPPSLQEQGKLMIRHFEMILKLYPPEKAASYFRKFLVYYVKQHPERKKAQCELIHAKTTQEVFHALRVWYPAGKV